MVFRLLQFVAAGIGTDYVAVQLATALASLETLPTNLQVARALRTALLHLDILEMSDLVAGSQNQYS